MDPALRGLISVRAMAPPDRSPGGDPVSRDTDRPSVSVVIPTYLEGDNLRDLIPRIGGVLDTIGVRHEIVVVDDASPDDTAGIVAQLSADHPVRLLTRIGERGLATAVVHGIRSTVGEIVVVMDADHSHPPEVIPALLTALDGVDMAIASRWVRGGGTADGWGPIRRLNSALATALARSFTSVKDPMTGFFAVRRATIDSGAPLDPIGFKIALEIIVKCDCRTVAEVPFEFQLRAHGRSKLDLGAMLLFVRHLGRLHRFRLARRRRSRLALGG